MAPPSLKELADKHFPKQPAPDGYVHDLTEAATKPLADEKSCADLAGKDFLTNGNLLDLDQVIITRDGDGKEEIVISPIKSGKSSFHPPSGTTPLAFDGNNWWDTLYSTQRFAYQVPQGNGLFSEEKLKICQHKEEGVTKAYVYRANKLLDQEQCTLMQQRDNPRLILSATDVVKLVVGGRLTSNSTYCVKPAGEKDGEDHYQLLVSAGTIPTIQHLINEIKGGRIQIGATVSSTTIAGQETTNSVVLGLLEAIRPELEDRVRAKESMDKQSEGLELGKSQAFWATLFGAIGSGIGAVGLIVTVVIFAKQMKLMRDQMDLMRKQMLGPEIKVTDAVVNLTERLKQEAFKKNPIGEFYARQFEDAFTKPGLISHVFRNGPTGGSKGFSIDYFFTELLQELVPGWKGVPVEAWSVSGGSFKSTAGAWQNQESKLLREIMDQAVEASDRHLKETGKPGEIFIALREADALLGDGHMGPNSRFFKELLSYMEAKDNPKWSHVHWIIDTSRPQEILKLLPDMSRRVTFIESTPPKVNDLAAVVQSRYEALKAEFPGVEVDPKALKAIAYLGENSIRGASPAAQTKLLEEVMKTAFNEARRNRGNGQVSYQRVCETLAREQGVSPQQVSQEFERRQSDPTRADAAIEKAFYSKYEPVAGHGTVDPDIVALRQQFEEFDIRERERVTRDSARHWAEALLGQGASNDDVEVATDALVRHWTDLSEAARGEILSRVKQGSPTVQYLQTSLEAGAEPAAVIPLEYVRFLMENPSPKMVEASLYAIAPETPRGEMGALVDDVIKKWEATPVRQRLVYAAGTRLRSGGIPVDFLREKVCEPWERERRGVTVKPENEWDIQKRVAGGRR